MREPIITISQELIKVLAEVEEFKGRWQALKSMSPEKLSILRKVATIESIGSSTRIEGAQLTDSKVEALLSNLKTTHFATRDEQEVAGYAEAMDLVFQSHEDLPITENHIKQMHQVLLRHSNKDERHRGQYKTLPNHVIARDDEGKEIGIVFETVTPFKTPNEMEALVKWATKTINEQALHPLLLIAVFIVVFLRIHPFQDGNGRLSRILTNLMLLRAGYLYVPYVSLESIVEDNKDLYYKALRRTQTTLSKENPDWEPWIGFFLRCLQKQKNNLLRKIEKETPVLGQPQISAPKEPLPLHWNEIIALLQKNERLTAAQLETLMRINPNTLKLHLRKLVAAGLINRHGKARATWYQAK